jgi:3-methylcrotonyl-CoA carboxylase alpha subunit
MERAGIPTIPGYHGENQNSDFLYEQAKKVGLPLMIKASAGGGGKGMRIVRDMDSFKEQLESAKSEARKSFGDDTVLIERFIENPRHIEVQVMSDTHGNHLHFYERECSIQRRHQKIIEETPSPALDDKLREKICETAVKISSSINYRGAGTVEFILDEKGEFFFLEMNTRLQVEHPITEMVTGVDLVRLQIEVANGNKISLRQEDISQRGHAIEVRLYAEDPDNNFMPSIGKIWKVGTIDFNNVRFDNGFNSGNEVTINFDPMLSKFIVWDQNREHSIDKMVRSLNHVGYLGVKTNREYLQRVLQSKPFKKGDITTNFITDYEQLLVKRDQQQDEVALAIAGFLSLKGRRNSTIKTAEDSKSIGPWNYLGKFRNI